MIGAVFYTLLGLFNPVLEIEIDDQHLTTGESCSVRWSFTGNTGRIRHSAALARGSATLTVPERTMPSFESSNNKIEWRLNVHGDIPHWPDVVEEFPVHVHPAGGTST